MYKEFVKNGKNPIYEADQFRRFCQAAGAQSLFDDILSSVTNPRHSENRLKLNEKRVVGIIYNLVYCLSQRCNAMQVDQALYLQTSHANQEAILTEHQLGNTCSRRLMNNIRKSLSSNHRDDLQQFFADAIKNEWLLVLVIDDYTTIHTIRRPTQTKFSQANNMCTIIVKAFKEIPAIRRPNDITLLHDPNGMNIEALLATITSPVQMSMLGNSYAATLPNWITDDFFNPVSQLDRLRDHQYCEGHLVRDMRKMDNVHLVNFVELTLKGKNAFEKAYDIAMATDLKSYAKKDWPCQFYCRQVVYQQTYNVQKKKPSKQQQKRQILSLQNLFHQSTYLIMNTASISHTPQLLLNNKPHLFCNPILHLVLLLQ